VFFKHGEDALTALKHITIQWNGPILVIGETSSKEVLVLLMGPKLNALLACYLRYDHLCTLAVIFHITEQMIGGENTCNTSNEHWP